MVMVGLIVRPWILLGILIVRMWSLILGLLLFWDLGRTWRTSFYVLGLLLLLMLDDIDVLLLIWLGFDLLVGFWFTDLLGLVVDVGWNFMLWVMLEKKIFEYYVLRFCDLGLCFCNLGLSSCLFMFFNMIWIYVFLRFKFCFSGFLILLKLIN